MMVLALGACAGTPQESAELPTIMALPSETSTPDVSNTPGPTPTPSDTPTLTHTPTATASSTGTGTATVTPSLTITDTPTLTSTPTPSETYEITILDILAQTAAASTVLPPNLVPTPTPGGLTGGAIPPTLPPPGGVTGGTGGTSCTETPQGGFGRVYFSDPTLPALLGCPQPNTLSTVVQAASQTFERGTMLWVQGPINYIYVLYNTGTYQRFADTWVDGSLVPISSPPPPGLYEPVRGFGKVWRENPAVNAGLGWGLGFEIASVAARQDFQLGTMLALQLRGDTLVLTYTVDPTTGTWRAYPGGY